MPVSLIAILALALILATWLVVRQQNLRLRQMRHHERLAALAEAAKAGQTPSREGDPTMSETTTQSPATTDPAEQWKDPATYTHWFRVTTLGLAFLLLFGGAGMLAAFIIVPDAELQKLWSLGLIPIMAGVGLLLFSLVSGKLTDDTKN